MPMTASDVVDAASFALYAHQLLGTPVPASKDMPVLRKKLNEHFAAHPRSDWRTLAALVEWCRAKRRHPALTWAVLANVKWAWSDGALPLLDPVEVPDKRVEFSIDQALRTETDEDWRRMLVGACGLDNRREVMAAWRLAHQ
jgi:hypothetical protein